MDPGPPLPRGTCRDRERRFPRPLGVHSPWRSRENEGRKRSTEKKKNEAQKKRHRNEGVNQPTRPRPQHAHRVCIQMQLHISRRHGMRPIWMARERHGTFHFWAGIRESSRRADVWLVSTGRPISSVGVSKRITRRSKRPIRPWAVCPTPHIAFRWGTKAPGRYIIVNQSGTYRGGM